MPASKPIVPGEVFGRLTIISEAPKRGKDIHRRVIAQCECGEIRDIMYSLVVTGKTVSCGCYRRTKNITHGDSNNPSHRTYYIYRDMLTRCYNPKYKEFHLYGGRGIQVCDRWRYSYENFLEDMGRRPDNLTLERVDYNRNYSPENCRWADIIEQANNKRNNIVISYKGRSQTIPKWSRELGVPINRLYSRYYAGWEPERILFEEAN